MKKIIITFIVAATLGASGYTVHRSFKNGYPAGSAPSQNTGASIGVNGAKLNAQDAQPAKGKEKLKDDGACWAITAAGTRCKLKKVGDTDYCALHAADKKPAKPVDQCCAMTWEGTRCTRKPDEGYRYCAQHRKQPVSTAKKAAPQPKKK